LEAFWGWEKPPLEKAGAFLRMSSKLRMPSKTAKHFDKLTVFPVTFVRLRKSFHGVLLIGFLVHPPDVDMVDEEEHEEWCGYSCKSGSGARSPSFLEFLCFDCFTNGLGVFLFFLVVWAVLRQNLSQSPPLVRMKLVISRKA
jgi:hypothetical protein